MYRFASRVVFAVPLAMMSFTAGGALAEEIAVVERATTDTVTDIGAKGDSAGTYSPSPTRSSTRTTRRRWEPAVAGASAPPSASPGSASGPLPWRRGASPSTAPSWTAQNSMLAVTGGTGAYSGASGEMKLHARDAKGSEYDFVFTLK